MAYTVVLRLHYEVGQGMAYTVVLLLHYEVGQGMAYTVVLLLHYEVGQGMAYTVVFHHIVYYYCLRLAREVVSVVVVWGRERRGYGI
jgi:hypothetical protein